MRVLGTPGSTEDTAPQAQVAHPPLPVTPPATPRAPKHANPLLCVPRPRTWLCDRPAQGEGSLAGRHGSA